LITCSGICCSSRRSLDSRCDPACVLPRRLFTGMPNNRPSFKETRSRENFDHLLRPSDTGRLGSVVRFRFVSWWTMDSWSTDTEDRRQRKQGRRRRAKRMQGVRERRGAAGDLRALSFLVALPSCCGRSFRWRAYRCRLCSSWPSFRSSAQGVQFDQAVIHFSKFGRELNPSFLRARNAYPIDSSSTPVGISHDCVSGLARSPCCRNKLLAQS
jgi:hypothetical protein